MTTRSIQPRGIQPRGVEPDGNLATMLAIEQRGYGGPEQLVATRRPVPQPGPGEVIVRVAAAGLDAGLVHLLGGYPRVVRLALPLKGSRVLGTDFAGVVHAIGPGVAGVAVGDEVFGTTVLASDGSLAEFARARADRIAPKPAALGFDEAAALPVSGTTALKAVDAARIRPGQRVLVLGAAGGVGHFVVQLAKAAGAHVTGVASAAKLDLVRELGADEAIDYAARDPLAEAAASGARYDAIIDIAGHRRLSALRRALTPRGCVVLVGSEAPDAPLGGLGRTALAALIGPFGRRKIRALTVKDDRESLLRLTELVEAGALRPFISARYPLTDAAEAVAQLGRGHGTGKVVVIQS